MSGLWYWLTCGCCRRTQQRSKATRASADAGKRTAASRHRSRGPAAAPGPNAKPLKEPFVVPEGAPKIVNSIRIGIDDELLLNDDSYDLQLLNPACRDIFMRASLTVEDSHLNKPLQIIWVAEDTQPAAPPNYPFLVIELKAAHRLTARASLPEKDWPSGAYRVDLQLEGSCIAFEEVPRGSYCSRTSNNIRSSVPLGRG